MSPLLRSLFGSLVAAALTVVGAHVITVSLYAVASRELLQNLRLPMIITLLGYTPLFLFIVLTLAGLAGALTTRFGGFLLGIVLSMLCLVSGTLVGYLGSGRASVPLGSAILSMLTLQFWIVATPFVLCVAIIWATVGRFYARAIIVPVIVEEAELAAAPIALLPPAAQHAHRGDAVADRRELLRDYGWRVVEVGTEAELSGVVVRLGEAVLVRAESVALSASGLHIIRLSEGVRIEREDLIVVGDTVLVSPSEWTDAAGIADLRTHAADFGVSVRVVETAGADRLAQIALALPDGTVWVDPALLRAPSTVSALRPRLAPPAGICAVLDSRTIAVPEHSAASAEELQALGFGIVRVGEDSGVVLVG